MDCNSPCPLDKEYSDQISALLSPPPPPPPQSVQEYYDEVIEATKCTGVRVSCSSKHGKGVYANRDFTEDELILKDQILVGAQHSSNKVDCLVCSYCYRFIGSIELQIGRRLYLQSLGLSTGKHCHDDTGSSSSINMKENSPPEEVLKSLISGNLSLPYTSQFAFPPVIACPGGCEEEHYCSQLCAESDWTSYHSLLCTGSNTGQSRRSALLQFIDHANGTNDIFLVAAKAISFTILRYKKLKILQGVDNEQHPTPDNSNKSDFSLLLEAWKPVSMGFKKRWWDCIALPDDVELCDEASFRTEIRDLAFTVCVSSNMISTFTYLLRNLFVVLVIMWKLLMGDDNDSIISIFQSLQLLKDAIFDIECAPLFSLEVYGHIIGMFELNNLDLVVASPVEDYFIYIDDLSQREKEEAERVTRPFLEALGDEYSVSCQGTAFFPIQSCMNHSCCPNAKAFKRDEDKDGRATILALQPISEGGEITISYIDEDLPYEERRALLADYGFSCMCPRCLEEQPQ